MVLRPLLNTNLLKTSHNHTHMIEVIRLSHRLPRDSRTTTHCALVARAFGATQFTYGGQKDKGFEAAVNKVTEQFGGPFTVTYEKNTTAHIKKRKEEGFTIAHATMYGEQVQTLNLKKHKKLLIIIGGERVEPIIYELADYNVSVTNQPHSEVMALGYILDYYLERKELTKTFKNAKKQVIPQKKGKLVKS